MAKSVLIRPTYSYLEQVPQERVQPERIQPERVQPDQLQLEHFLHLQLFGAFQQTIADKATTESGCH